MKYWILLSTLLFHCGNSHVGPPSLSPEEQFFQALERNDRAEMQALVHAGFDLNGRYGAFREPLIMQAVRRKEVKSISAMLSLGADPRALNSLCIDALTIATQLGKTKLCFELLDHGANPFNEGCHHGESAMGYARLYGHHALAQKLDDIRSERALQHRETEKRFQAIENGEAIDDWAGVASQTSLPRNDQGDTPLIAAARVGRTDLIARFVGVSLEARNYFDETALMVAVNQGHEAFTRTLLAEGADLETRDLFGRTPLHQAVSKGDRDVTLRLLQHGARVAVRDCFGEDLLETVLKHDDAAILEIIMPYLGESPDELRTMAGKRGAIKVDAYLAELVAQQAAPEVPHGF